ncbi:DoxX family protein [Foetidibacter luteolus]|uniref:DoxX family protein n=1 Tax=Foetidibacter luteolus TaxID=2608880 RepID=UPI00129A1A10|nr:DoxX family protein [Foetidibacter luteolus]
MNNSTVSRLATIVFAIVIAVFGIIHFKDPDVIAVRVPDFIPGDKLWVYFVGACLILAAIAFLLDKKAKLAGFLLAALLVIFVLTVHLPGYLNTADREQQFLSFMNLLKDTGLAAGALLIASRAAASE